MEPAHKSADPTRQIARSLLVIVESIGLLVITLATIVAIYQEVASMVLAAKVSLADLLMMFLYLEVLAMVGLYYQSGKMPVRYPLYIAIIALARYIILEVKELSDWRLLSISVSILIVAVGILLIRYGEIRLAYPESQSKPLSPEALTRKREADDGE